MREIYSFCRQTAGSKSQDISNGSVAILVKQAVEIPLVDFLYELVGQLETINQFSKQFHFSRVFMIVSRNYAQNHEHQIFFLGARQRFVYRIHDLIELVMARKFVRRTGNKVQRLIRAESEAFTQQIYYA